MSLTNSADSYNISGAYPAPDLIQTRLVSIYLYPYLSTYPSIFIYLDMITMSSLHSSSIRYFIIYLSLLLDYILEIIFD